jgi:hypothetical protein
MLLEIDGFRRVQLSNILASAPSFSELVNSDLHNETSDILKPILRLLAEDDVDLETYVSDQQLAALAVIVDAAWTYTNRSPSPMPTTGLNTIIGLNDKDFCDLSAWLADSRHTGFHSVDPADPDHPSDAPAPTVVEIDKERHKQLVEILTYVKENHFHIDPDMYKVGAMHFDALKDVLRRSALRSEVTISSDESNRVSTLIDAASTYSYRSKGDGLPRIKRPDFDRLSAWIGTAFPK